MDVARALAEFMDVALGPDPVRHGCDLTDIINARKFQAVCDDLKRMDRVDELEKLTDRVLRYLTTIDDQMVRAKVGAELLGRKGARLFAEYVERQGDGDAA